MQTIHVIKVAFRGHRSNFVLSLKPLLPKILTYLTCDLHVACPLTFIFKIVLHTSIATRTNQHTGCFPSSSGSVANTLPITKAGVAIVFSLSLKV